MTSVSANPTTDAAGLENLLFKATNPSNKLEDVNTIKQFCDLINRDESENSSVIAIRLLAHKIQSPQEMEAIQALAVLEACVKSCGKPFIAEVGKFKFLNEMIKMVSPRYLGSRTPEHVKKKVIELLYLWSTSIKEETKISEAYQMLKTQGIVTQDPTHVKDAVFAPSLPPRLHEDPLSEDQTKILKKLLQSRNPEDLQKANKIIRGMVQEDEKRIEALSKRSSELTLVSNNAKLLNEMLDHYEPGRSGSGEDELLKELSLSCEKMQPKIYRLASEAEDDELGEILSASDEISRVLERYRTLVIDGKTPKKSCTEEQTPKKSSSEEQTPKKSSSEEQTLLDMNNESEMSLMDDDILNLLSSNSPTSASPPNNKPSNVIDLLTNGSPIKSSLPPISSSFLPSNASGSAKKDTVHGDPSTSRTKGLLELDALGEEAMKALLPSVTPEFTKKYEKKPTMNDLQKQKKDESLQLPPQPVPPKTLPSSVQASNEEVEKKEEDNCPKKLSEITVALSDIQPGEFPPLGLSSDDSDIGINLHFAKEELFPGIQATVLTITNKSSFPVSDIELKPVVPKGVKVKLQEPSGKELPVFNPFIPPPAITQIMLLQKSQNSNQISSFKYVVSYRVENEILTEMGSSNDLPI